MLTKDWNALRSGDHVLVHDADVRVSTLAEGVVIYVDVVRGNNEVSIRVRDAVSHAVVLPARQSVHLDPVDPADRCWRCGTGPGPTH